MQTNVSKVSITAAELGILRRTLVGTHHRPDLLYILDQESVNCGSIRTLVFIKHRLVPTIISGLHAYRTRLVYTNHRLKSSIYYVRKLLNAVTCTTPHGPSVGSMLLSLVRRSNLLEGEIPIEV